MDDTSVRQARKRLDDALLEADPKAAVLFALDLFHEFVTRELFTREYLLGKDDPVFAYKNTHLAVAAPGLKEDNFRVIGPVSA